jgi:hypothetical protein
MAQLTAPRCQADGHLTAMIMGVDVAAMRG